MKIFLAGKVHLPKNVSIKNILISYHYIEEKSQDVDFYKVVKERRKQDESK